MSAPRRLRLFLLPLLCALALAPLRASQERPPRTRVLFVGNSYTYFHNLPDLLVALAQAGGRTIETRMVAPGGWRLRDHFEKGEAPRVLGEEHWDFVVLQEQSTLGTTLYVDGLLRVGDDAVFRPWAERWTEAVHRAGAEPVLYLTWARKASPEDQATLTQAITSAAVAGQAALAPVGPAWALARARRPELELYFTDGSHPSPAGSYLAACTLYATLFASTPVGLPSALDGAPIDLDSERVENGKRATLVRLEPADARLLQEVAWEAVQALGHGPREAITRPTGAALPALPAGVALGETALAGQWKGELAFYPGAAAQVRLILDPPRAGSSWSGVLELVFPGHALPDAEVELASIDVGEKALAFGVPHLPMDLDLSCHAVLRADGVLALQAEARSGTESEPLRLLGSASLRRSDDGD